MASGDIIIKEIIFTNVTASDGTITLYFVPTGDSATVANMIVNATTISAGDTLVMSLSTVIETGGTIQAVQSDASRITLCISGIAVS